VVFTQAVAVRDLDVVLFFVMYGGASHPSGLFVTMAALTALGSGWSMLAILPMLAVPRTRRLAKALLVTLIVTAAIVFVVKLATARVRPCAALPGVHALFGAPTDFSFPSGHAAGAFAFAAFVGTIALTGARTPLRVSAVLATFALAASIALSRVYLGCHFPGDVLAGAITGAVVGAAGARLHLRRA
jgi:undecaprenyl-diphosphatase